MKIVAVYFNVIYFRFAKNINNVLLLLCVRLLWFSKSTQFGEVAKSNFHSSCVLQIDHVICRYATANERASSSANQSSGSTAANHSSACIISAGTDGRICVWNVTELVMGFCRSLFAESENDEIGPTLTETCCRNVAGEQHGDSSPKIEAGDTQLETGCRNVAGQAHAGGSLQNIEGSDTQTETVCRDVAVHQSNIKVSVTQAAFDSYVGSFQLTEASERQAKTYNISDTAYSSERNKASGRFDTKLEEPCCVITAHQSGVNSLAIRQRLSGSPYSHIV